MLTATWGTDPSYILLFRVWTVDLEGLLFPWTSVSSVRANGGG